MAVSLSIVSEFAGKGIATAIQQFKQLDSTTEKAAFAFKKLFIPGAVAATGAVLAFTKGVLPAVNAASDLEESMSKNNVVFGDAASSVSSFADQAARALGQSKTQALAAASTFGTMGKAAGLAGQELATFSTEFVTLASDLASFNNTTPEDAINALGAALRGEAEPMRRFGVLLNDATLKQAAMELGIYKGNGALTAQQKILAAQKIIFEQTTDAQGDFERTSDGLANQQRILAAQIDDLQAKIGQLLLPVFKRVVQYINDNILPALSLMIDGFKEKGLSGAFTYFVASFGDGSKTILDTLRNVTIGVATLGGQIGKLGGVLALALIPVIGFDKAWSLYKASTDGAADATAAINDKFDEFARRVEAAQYRLDLFKNSAQNVNNVIYGAEQRLAGYGKEVKNLGVAAEETEEKKKKLGSGMSEAEKKAKALADKTKELANVLEKEMAGALDNAKDRLNDAQKAFDDFGGSVSRVISDALNFEEAFQKSGEEGGKSFFEELQTQANKAKDFGVLVERLLAAGISKEALDQVMAAGVDSGTAIAQELLKSAENILRANKLVEETQAIAERIGLAAANKFYLAGVQNGQAYLRGVEEAIAAANARLAGAKRPADVKGAGALFSAGMSAAAVGAGVVNNYNVTANSLDPRSGADAVVDALIEYNRRSGPLQLEIA